MRLLRTFTALQLLRLSMWIFDKAEALLAERKRE